MGRAGLPCLVLPDGSGPFYGLDLSGSSRWAPELGITTAVNGSHM